MGAPSQSRFSSTAALIKAPRLAPIGKRRKSAFGSFTVITFKSVGMP